jgi:hypothetical protein
VFGGFGSAVELGVHGVDAEVDGDLDSPFPRPDGGLAFVFTGPGPAQHRQHGGDPDPGVGGAFAELGDAGVVDAGVAEEGDEVGLGGQLHPVVAHAGDHVGEFEHRVGGVEHLRVEGELHRCPPRGRMPACVRMS